LQAEGKGENRSSTGHEVSQKIFLPGNFAYVTDQGDADQHTHGWTSMFKKLGC